MRDSDSLCPLSVRRQKPKLSRLNHWDCFQHIQLRKAQATNHFFPVANITEDVVLDDPGILDLREPWWPQITKATGERPVLFAIAENGSLIDPIEEPNIAPEERIVRFDIRGPVPSRFFDQMQANGDVNVALMGARTIEADILHTRLDIRDVARGIRGSADD